MASYTPDLQGPISAPPAPPPKPGSHDTSGISTPTPTTTIENRPVAPMSIPDPGDSWLPKILQDKSKQELQEILANPTLLHALTHSPSTIHPSLQQSHTALQTALTENIDLATHLQTQESHLAHHRSTVSTQLLSTLALERQWRARQSALDVALAPFAPASLYQRLVQGVVEQGQVCAALEESFLDGEGEVGEREVGEWVRRYREGRVRGYVRGERKERWDEGRVGGWR